MSTDTAILVSDTILNYGMQLQDIPKIVNPEFVKNNSESVVLEGFVYVSNEMDLETRTISKKENPIPIMSDKIRKELIFEELGF